MNSERNALLDQLRDIHAAPDVGWWPPAPGWWMLAALLTVALILLLRRALSAWRVRRRRRHLLQELDALSDRHDPETQPQDYLAGVNRLLKLVAVRSFSNRRCARMQGEEWSRFLRQHHPGEDAPGVLDVLAHGPYEPAPCYDAGALERAARRWIVAHG